MSERLPGWPRAGEAPAVLADYCAALNRQADDLAEEMEDLREQVREAGRRAKEAAAAADALAARVQSATWTERDLTNAEEWAQRQELAAIRRDRRQGVMRYA